MDEAMRVFGVGERRLTMLLVGYWQEAAEAGGFEGVPLVVASPDQIDALAPLLGTFIVPRSADRM